MNCCCPCRGAELLQAHVCPIVKHLSETCCGNDLPTVQVIPGNETKVAEMLNSLAMQGARVMAGRADNLHVSGHAYQVRPLLLLLLGAAPVPSLGLDGWGTERHALVCCASTL